MGEVSLDFDLIWTRTGTSRDLFPLTNGRLLDIGECLISRTAEGRGRHCCASLAFDRQNILLMDYITGLIVLGINITILLSRTVAIGNRKFRTVLQYMNHP